MIAVLRVDDEGTVAVANPAATALFGHCLGRRCCDVVLARIDRRRLWCAPGCAGIAPGSASGHDRCGLLVRGRISRVLCQRLGADTVVFVEVGPPALSGEVPTPRERQVLELAASGLDTEGIAQRLGIGRETARTHADRARAKLGARTRAEAVAVALRLGLLGPWGPERPQ